MNESEVIDGENADVVTSLVIDGITDLDLDVTARSIT